MGSDKISLVIQASYVDVKRTKSLVIAPLFKTSHTDYATLYTVLSLTQNIPDVIIGPERRTLITLDLDLYNSAVKIHESVCNCNWVLRAGILHIAFASLHALGKTVEGSGVDTCAIDSGIYSSVVLRGIYGGKALKREVEYHVINALAIMMMEFDAIFGELQPEPLRLQCVALKHALHERDPKIVGIFEDIQSYYATQVQKQEKQNELESCPNILTNT